MRSKINIFNIYPKRRGEAVAYERLLQSEIRLYTEICKFDILGGINIHSKLENDGFHEQNFDLILKISGLSLTINRAKVNVSMPDINV